jgi:hypothetical protein
MKLSEILSARDTRMIIAPLEEGRLEVKLCMSTWLLLTLSPKGGEGRTDARVGIWSWL